MRTPIFLGIVFLALGACKKDNNASVKPSTNTTTDSTLLGNNNDSIAELRNPHVDSLVGEYTGTLREYKETVTDADTDTPHINVYDQTHTSTMTVKNIVSSKDKVTVTIKYAGELITYTLHYTNSNKFNAPLPGGYKMYFYPEGDSATYYTEGWVVTPKYRDKSFKSAHWTKVK